MTMKLINYIHFDGNAREAADFYQSVFGGELQMSTFADYASAEMPIAEEERDKIMHCYLRGDNGVELMLSDTPESMEFQDGQRVTLALSSDNEDEGRAVWVKLAEGGVIVEPLAESPWNSIFGMLIDKYEVNWMLDIGVMS